MEASEMTNNGFTRTQQTPEKEIMGRKQCEICGVPYTIGGQPCGKCSRKNQMTSNSFTPTQQAMLDVLADGERHTTRELHACLPDELGPLSNVRQHISNLRKALRNKREGILCVYNGGKFFYQWVRLLHPSQLP